MHGGYTTRLQRKSNGGPRSKGGMPHFGPRLSKPWTKGNITMCPLRVLVARANLPYQIVGHSAPWKIRIFPSFIAALHCSPIRNHAILTKSQIFTCKATWYSTCETLLECFRDILFGEHILVELAKKFKEKHGRVREAPRGLTIYIFLGLTRFRVSWPLSPQGWEFWTIAVVGKATYISSLPRCGHSVR